MTDTEASGWGFSLYYLRLQRALETAVDGFEATWAEIAEVLPIGGDFVSQETIALMNTLEEKRATALLVTAACVEGVANLYLRLKATPEQLLVLERSSFLEKWTVIPTLFLVDYSLPKDSELFQDLKRLQIRRNAIAHLKEEVTAGNGTIHESPHPATAGDEHIFVGRCRTLALRLIRHVATFDHSSGVRTIFMTLAFKPGAI